MKKSIVILLLVFSTSLSYSQMHYGGQISYLSFFGGLGIKHFGAGIKGGYGINDKSGVYGALNFYVPKGYVGQVELSALTPDISPGTISGPSTSRVSFTNAHVGFKRYFLGDYEGDDNSPLGIFAMSDIGLMVGSAASNIPDFDETKYSSPVIDDVKKVFINYVWSIGFGADYLVGNVHFYADAKFGVTFDEANRFIVKTYLPSYVMYNIGVRIPLPEKHY